MPLDESVVCCYYVEVMLTSITLIKHHHLYVVLKLLVSFGAPLFIENSAKETPCDCAEKAGHSQIALYLESKMVFSVI